MQRIRLGNRTIQLRAHLLVPGGNRTRQIQVAYLLFHSIAHSLESGSLLGDAFGGGAVGLCGLRGSRLSIVQQLVELIRQRRIRLDGGSQRILQGTAGII